MSNTPRPPDLSGTGKTKHVFICYSQRDSKFAREEIIHRLQGEGFITCDFEDDFIPGVSIFENITTAIKESRKYILIISEHFNESWWCEYESQLTLSLSIDMKVSNVVIPLLLDGAKVPEYLSIFQEVKVNDNSWFEKICKSLGTPIKELPQTIDIPPPLRGKEYHFISIAHLEIDDKLQKLDTVRHKTFLNFLDVKVKKDPNSNGCELFVHGHEQLFKLSIKELIGTVEKYIRKSSKTIFWLSKPFESDSACKNLLDMLCLMAQDKSIETAPWVIPICLENDLKFPDNLRQTCLFTRNGKWYERMLQAVCRRDIGYRCKKQELIFREDVELFRIAEFEGRMFKDEKSPRLLGVTFIEEEHIILLDADNYTIKKCTLLGEIILHIKLPKRPNRLSRVDNSHVAIIYENDVEIIILNTKNMSKKSNIKPPLKDGEVIKGITALSLTEFFIATNGGTGNPRIIQLEITGGIPKIFNFVDRCGKHDVFEMPRRLTATPDKSKVIVADENDRRIILLDRDCNLIHAQDKWNRSLYNLRGVTASNDTIYIAACNGVTTANLNNTGTKKNTADVKNLDIHPEPLIKFPSIVHHTRSVALDQSGKYFAVSQATDNKEIVRVFVMPNPADMSCKCTTPTKTKRHFLYAFLFDLWEAINYLE